MLFRGRRRRAYRRPLLPQAAAAALLLALGATSGAAAAPPKTPPVEPGREQKLEVPGCPYPCVVYVAADYAPGKRLPLILVLAPQGGAPTTWPFREVAGGKGYLVVGLSYGAQPDGGAKGLVTDEKNNAAMVQFIAKVRALVKDRYGFNDRQVFLAGLSMGGWAVNYYGFRPDVQGLYRGFVILAAGPIASRQVRFAAAKGLPVLLVNGEKDFNLATANRFKGDLARAGAIVTPVVIPGQGHVPAIETVVGPLGTWLQEHAPLTARDLREMAAQARAAESGRLGLALTLYEDLAAAGAAEPGLEAALARGRQLLAAARAELEAAPTPADLRRVSARYKGHPLADEALARAADLEAKPKP